MNLKICMVGCFKNSINTLDELKKNGFKINTIVTINPNKAKKLNVSNYFNFNKYAKNNNIKKYSVKKYNLKDKRDLEFFKKEKFDLLFIGGWNRLIPNNILKTLKLGGIGFHASPNLLPSGRGRSPMNWAIIKNKKNLILHMFYLNIGADDGKIIYKENFKIQPWDNIYSIYLKYQMLLNKLLIKFLNNIKNNKKIKSYKQIGKPRYFPKRKPSDGHIDFNKMDSMKIFNQVRATSKPYPGSFFYFEGKKITIWKCIPFDDINLNNRKNNPGEILYKEGKLFLIESKNGRVLIQDSENSKYLKVGKIANV